MQFKKYSQKELNQIAKNKEVNETVKFYNKQLETSKIRNIKLYLSDVFRIINAVENANIDLTDSLTVQVTTLEYAYKMGVSVGFIEGLKEAKKKPVNRYDSLANKQQH